MPIEIERDELERQLFVARDAFEDIKEQLPCDGLCGERKGCSECGCGNPIWCAGCVAIAALEEMGSGEAAADPTAASESPTRENGAVRLKADGQCSDAADFDVEAARRWLSIYRFGIREVLRWEGKNPPTEGESICKFQEAQNRLPPLLYDACKALEASQKEEKALRKLYRETNDALEASRAEIVEERKLRQRIVERETTHLEERAERAERERDLARTDAKQWREVAGERYSLSKLPGVLFYCKDHARTVHAIMEECDALKAEVEGLRETAKPLSNFRVFITSRERAKTPEGVDLFDEICAALNPDKPEDENDS